MTADEQDTTSPADDPLVLHAWVDESIRVTATGGFYILASVIVDAACCDGVRDTLRDLLLRNQPRLHWRAEDKTRRRKIAQTAANIDMAAVVVVGTPVTPTKQERARRVCMERLLHELDQLGVHRAWLETRTPSLNTKDWEMVAALIGARAISTRLRIAHARPLEEPMLWLPDAVAGAVSAAHAGVDEYLSVMRQVVTQIDVHVR
jgi:hypothetical protein